MPSLALQGVRLLEITTGIAGPFCAKMLADYEAEVIKVEQSRWGDSSRYCGPLAALLGPRMWPNLARMIDRPGLTEDARFPPPETGPLIEMS